MKVTLELRESENACLSKTVTWDAIPLTGSSLCCGNDVYVTTCEPQWNIDGSVRIFCTGPLVGNKWTNTLSAQQLIYLKELGWTTS